MTFSAIGFVEIIGFIFIGFTMKVVFTSIIDFLKTGTQGLKEKRIYGCLPYMQPFIKSMSLLKASYPI